VRSVRLFTHTPLAPPPPLFTPPPPFVDTAAPLCSQIPLAPPPFTSLTPPRNTFETVRDLPGGPWPYGDLPVVVITSGNNGEITVPERLVGKTEVVTVGEAGVAGVLDGLHAKYAATNVYIDGGIAIRSFIEAGLIGRAIITAVPETLGDGIALFSKEHLAMLKKEGEDLVFDNGCVQTTYVLR